MQPILDVEKTFSVFATMRISSWRIKLCNPESYS
jgi:hypothetical protein